METIEQMVAKMSAFTAKDVRNKLDETPANELPGADAVGATAARNAYRVYRSLLTARIEAVS